MIEQRSNHNERDGIAERQAMIAGIGSKQVFCFVSHAVAVGDNLKPGLDIAEKRKRGPKVTPESQQRHRFADAVPGGAKRRADKGRFRDKDACPRVVGVLRIEAGIEAMKCRKNTRAGRVISGSRHAARRDGFLHGRRSGSSAHVASPASSSGGAIFSRLPPAQVRAAQRGAPRRPRSEP